MTLFKHVRHGLAKLGGANDAMNPLEIQDDRAIKKQTFLIFDPVLEIRQAGNTCSVLVQHAQSIESFSPSVIQAIQAHHFRKMDQDIPLEVFVSRYALSPRTTTV